LEEEEEQVDMLSLERPKQYNQFESKRTSVSFHVKRERPALLRNSSETEISNQKDEGPGKKSNIHIKVEPIEEEKLLNKSHAYKNDEKQSKSFLSISAKQKGFASQPASKDFKKHGK